MLINYISLTCRASPGHNDNDIFNLFLITTIAWSNKDHVTLKKSAVLCVHHKLINFSESLKIWNGSIFIVGLGPVQKADRTYTFFP